MMLAGSYLIAALVCGTLTTGDTAGVVLPGPADSLATVPASAGPVLAAPVGVVSVVDTVPVRRRPRAIEVSDAYEMRLRIHRYASYTMIPLFVVQSVAGNQLYVADQNGSPRPGWAKSTHSLGAAGLGALFTLNTVTGVWNLWESRDNEVGRTRRLVHSALLLASDAGFAWSGIKLASDAKNSSSSRQQHRNVAYVSMGTALAGYGVMLLQ
jgi:hypothetical protein